MTDSETQLLKALKDIVESYDLTIDYYKNKNEYVTGCIKGFFITIEKHKELIKKYENVAQKP